MSDIVELLIELAAMVAIVAGFVVIARHVDPDAFDTQETWHQERDHTVRCRRCLRRETWAHNALCDECTPQDAPAPRSSGGPADQPGGLLPGKHRAR